MNNKPEQAPPPLGKKIDKPAEQQKESWQSVEGKPHLSKDKDGRYKYAPPLPQNNSGHTTMSEHKVLLKFGYHLSFTVSVDTGMQIMKLLSQENLMKHDTRYKDSKSTNILVPWGTQEISLQLISPADYLTWCAQGDTE